MECRLVVLIRERFISVLLVVRVWITAREDKLTVLAVWLTALDTPSCILYTEG